VESNGAREDIKWMIQDFKTRYHEVLDLDGVATKHQYSWPQVEKRERDEMLNNRGVNLRRNNGSYSASLGEGGSFDPGNIPHEEEYLFYNFIATPED
jgi:hypothetical protein